MNYFTKNDKDFKILNGILGFQKIENNSTHCFIWAKQLIQKSDRKTPTMTWGKSIMSRDEVFSHFSSYIIKKGYLNLDILDSEFCDKWVTTEGEVRNFFKLILPFAISNATGIEFNIQVNQYLNTVPKSIIERLILENRDRDNTLLKMKEYLDKARVNTYGNQFGEKVLIPLYHTVGDKTYPIYEEKIVVNGEPKHRFVEGKALQPMNSIYIQRVDKVDNVNLFETLLAIEEGQIFT